MTLKEFNKKYIYKSDKDEFGTRLDIWEVIEEKDGKFEGDCESYMLSLQKYVPGFEDIELYYCKINGEGHCVGYRNNQIIDCNCKEFLDKDKYTKRYNMTDFKKYRKVQIWFKKLFRIIYKLFNR